MQDVGVEVFRMLKYAAKQVSLLRHFNTKRGL